jgi:assimilatory nitrate reductase catalytic subunit
LLNGIAHILIRDGLIDRDYIARHTTGFDELRAHVAKYTPARVANDRPGHHQIEQVAMLYGRSKAGFIGWTMGVNHSTQGAETVNAINNLALLTGNIGSGAAPFSITGQCNAMGTREAGFASGMPGYRKFESAADRRNWPRSGTSRRAHSPTRGLAYPDIIEAAVAKRVRALWIIATTRWFPFPITTYSSRL